MRSSTVHGESHQCSRNNCSDYGRHISGQIIGVDGHTETLYPRSVQVKEQIEPDGADTEHG